MRERAPSRSRKRSHCFSWAADALKSLRLRKPESEERGMQGKAKCLPHHSTAQAACAEDTGLSRTKPAFERAFTRMICTQMAMQAPTRGSLWRARIELVFDRGRVRCGPDLYCQTSGSSNSNRKSDVGNNAPTTIRRCSRLSRRWKAICRPASDRGRNALLG